MSNNRIILEEVLFDDYIIEGIYNLNIQRLPAIPSFKNTKKIKQTNKYKR